MQFSRKVFLSYLEINIIETSTFHSVSGNVRSTIKLKWCYRLNDLAFIFFDSIFLIHCKKHQPDSIRNRKSFTSRSNWWQTCVRRGSDFKIFSNSHVRALIQRADKLALKPLATNLGREAREKNMKLLYKHRFSHFHGFSFARVKNRRWPVTKIDVFLFFSFRSPVWLMKFYGIFSIK